MSAWPDEKLLGLRYSGTFYEARRTVIQFARLDGVFIHWDMDNDKWLRDYNSAPAYRFSAGAACFASEPLTREQDKCPYCGWTPAEQDALSNELLRLRERIAELETALRLMIASYDMTGDDEIAIKAARAALTTKTP